MYRGLIFFSIFLEYFFLKTTIKSENKGRYIFFLSFRRGKNIDPLAQYILVFFLTWGGRVARFRSEGVGYDCGVSDI